jgi:hypothetical protein
LFAEIREREGQEESSEGGHITICCAWRTKKLLRSQWAARGSVKTKFYEILVKQVYSAFLEEKNNRKYIIISGFPLLVLQQVTPTALSTPFGINLAPYTALTAQHHSASPSPAICRHPARSQRSAPRSLSRGPYPSTGGGGRAAASVSPELVSGTPPVRTLSVATGPPA